MRRRRSSEIERVIGDALRQVAAELGPEADRTITRLRLRLPPNADADTVAHHVRAALSRPPLQAELQSRPQPGTTVPAAPATAEGDI